MPRSTRTFVALAIPAALGEKLTRLQNQLTPEVPGVRWVTTQPFHLTLAFLGDVEDTDLNAVCRAVETVAGQFPPIELRLEGVGAFPNESRARVLWAGLVAKEPDLLARLHRTIAKAAAGAGYRADDARFTPHVTLGRIKADRRSSVPLDLASALDPARSWTGGAFTAREVITFASTLTPEGPVYAPLARAPLAGKKTAETP